jgi:threonine dehydratase
VNPQPAVTLGDIYRARRTISPSVRHTPLVPSPDLSHRSGASVFLKLETLQQTGSFKIRGATNRLMQLDAHERARGVVAVSTGNHGRAVAYAARVLGIRTTVCMSSLVPDNKLKAIRDLGADVRILGDSQDDAEEEAKRLIEQENMISVHPFDHPHIIAGQGVIGIELLEDLPEIDCLLVGLSGGGLVSGIAIALKSASPKTRVIGVSMERGPAMFHSIKAGKPVPVDEQKTLADSLGGGIGLDNRYTFTLVQQYVDDIVLVTEEQIAAAMTHLYRADRVVAEGAGSVGVAALLCDLVPNVRGNIVCVISGGNIDMGQFNRIVNGEYTFD